MGTTYGQPFVVNLKAVDSWASLFVLYPDRRTSTARRRVDDWHLVGVPPNIQYIAVTSDVVSLKGVPQ